LYGGALSDRIGRVRTFQIGYALVFVWMIPVFLLIDTRNIWLYGVALFLLTIGLGLSYGPMSAMYAEMFPVAVRYSGVSIGYALGAILGGAFAPMIAELLLQSTGWSARSVSTSWCSAPSPRRGDRRRGDPREEPPGGRGPRAAPRAHSDAAGALDVRP
jgi:MFS family permease